jgi:4'-phosphopantetheinyl transferase
MPSAATAAPPVRLWHWPLDLAAAETAALRALLSAEERARADRFILPGHTARFVVAHGRLRQLLGQLLGQPPVALAFHAGPGGKPELAVSGLRFSLSHTAGIAALAVAPFELGLDIEIIRPIDRDVPERFFSRPERDALRALPEPAWLDAFFRCWTRKEAVSKALGLGLALPLDQFSVSCSPAEPAALTWLADAPAAPETWQLAHLEVAPGCIGAVAAACRGWRIAWQANPWPDAI